MAIATLSITAANIRKGSGAIVITGAAGASETITGGMPVYQKTSDSLWYRMQADVLADSGTGLDPTSKMGIALGGATDGVTFAILTSGPITIGATIVAGQRYYINASIGLIGLFTDLATNDYITEVGIAASTTVLTVGYNPTGLQHA